MNSLPSFHRNFVSSGIFLNPSQVCTFFSLVQMQLFKNIDNSTKFQLDLDNAISTYIQQLFLEEFRSCVNADIIPFKRIPTIQAGTILFIGLCCIKQEKHLTMNTIFLTTYSDMTAFIQVFGEIGQSPITTISRINFNISRSWPQWSHNIQYWLDGTHVRWVLEEIRVLIKLDILPSVLQIKL